MGDFDLFPVHPREGDVQLLVKRFDKTGDGRLCFAEFSDAILPSDYVLAAALRRRPAFHAQGGYPSNRFFMAETRELFVNVLRQQLSLEAQTEFIR